MAVNSSQTTPIPATATSKTLIQPQLNTEKKVGVVYYLSLNGQLEHPHFIEVPLTSPHGLFLRDVINALNLLRGQGIGGMYSWASKRSYKNGYLWQDLRDDDFIHPSHGQDYILKGSLLPENSLSFRSTDSISSSRSRHSSVTNNSSSEDSNSPPCPRRKNYSWSSTDGINAENKVYKARTSSELSRTGSNVSTQTEDIIRRVQSEIQTSADELSILKLSRKQMSAPTLKSTQVYSSGNNVRYQKVVRDQERGKTKGSNLVMKLVGCGCGSKRFNDFDKMHNHY